MEQRVWQETYKIWISTLAFWSMCLHQTRWWPLSNYYSLCWQTTPICNIWWAHVANKIRLMHQMGNDWSWWTNQDYRWITQIENSVTISQKVYVESILEHEGLSEINSVATPLYLNVKLKLNPDGNEGSRSNSFARLLGELQYLANCTRPDISFAVNRLAAYTANPSIQHVTTLKRILRYLTGTKNLGITYLKTPTIILTSPMDSLTLPLQIMMITNRHQVMYS